MRGSANATDEAIQSVHSPEGTREGDVDSLPLDVTLSKPRRAVSEVCDAIESQRSVGPQACHAWSQCASLRARTYRVRHNADAYGLQALPPASVALISRSVCLIPMSRQSWSRGLIYTFQRILVIRAVTTKDSRGWLRVLLSAVVIQSQTKIPDGQHLSASYDIFG